MKGYSEDFKPTGGLKGYTEDLKPNGGLKGYTLYTLVTTQEIKFYRV